jgi:polar amino acid transport system substrate-binding protein
MRGIGLIRGVPPRAENEVRGVMKLTALIGFLVASLLLVGCGAQQGSGGSAQGGSGSEQSCDIQDPPLFEEGVLTVATDKPAYPPWFEGNEENYSGFEGEVANEVAERMDLPVEWVVEPFNRSYAPGAKDYDFDINQITITPERERAVDFSDGYFDNAQGVLALKSSPAAEVQTLSDLKDVQLGAQVGTTSRTSSTRRSSRTRNPRSTTPPTTPSPPWRAARSTPS